MSRAASIQVSLVVLAAFAAGATLSASDGDLDPAFGDGGVVTLTGHPGVSAVTFGLNGEVLLAMHDGPSIEVARLLANGEPDLLFHGDGFRTLGLAADEEATALAVQADGKLLVAGSVHIGPMASDDHLLVVRLTSGGFLDSSFGGGSGWTSVDFDPISAGPSTATQVLIQPDGKIVAIGEAYTVPILPAMADFELAVARLMPDGALDPDFRGGRVLVPFDLIPGGDERSGGGALLADGSLLLVGTAEVSASDSHVVAAKLDPGGQLDPTFGIGGKTSFAAPLLDPVISGVVVQPDGSSVVAGHGVDGATFEARPLFCELSASGSPVVCTFPGLGSGANYTIRAVAGQPDGRVLVAGTRVNTSNDSFPFLLRHDPSTHALDPSFATSGILVKSIPPAADDLGRAVAVSQDTLLLATLDAVGTTVLSLLNSAIFCDGFESGTFAAWDGAQGP